jgi:hypothetical protein
MYILYICIYVQYIINPINLYFFWTMAHVPCPLGHNYWAPVMDPSTGLARAHAIMLPSLHEIIDP